MDLLKVAGDTACLLEKYGVTACGRKRDGIVTLDCYGEFQGEHRTWSFQLDEHDRSSEILLARVLATVSDNGPSSRAD
ncbi:MAG: hypothetical protein U0174_05230 [Polyangiaceae bacterium]